ncbi:MAG: hypothetical protein DRJ10_10120 [Bacteroidetes bacterium]|nr:MAG: hypothetical protein DRJ10_10120 [Bacteroidota bacterium]
MSSLLTKALIICTYLLTAFIKISAQISYISPVPNSNFNNPETNLILKFESPIENINKLAKAFYIKGENSGFHKYNFKISGIRTLLLNPVSNFKKDETITIKLIDTIELENNNEILPFQFEFTTSKNQVYENNSISEFTNNNSRNKHVTDNFPSITISINDNPAPGKIFFYNASDMASNNDRFLAIIDNYGIPEYKRQENEIGLGFTLQPSGYLSFWNDQNFVLMDSSYNIIDTIGCGNGYSADFHDFIHLPNGHSILLAWNVQKIDMSKIVENGNNDADVQGLIIQELDENENVIFQWRSWDHFEITDAEDIDFTAPYVSYVHGNAIDIANDGNILLSSRVMNEITKIDRNTGEIIWRLGGKNNQFTYINDPDMFCRQHHIQQIANGNITLYDNGSCHEPRVSKAKEYKLDIANKTVELIWEYKHPKEMYCSTMGSVQRLDNGNTFITWGMIDNNDYPEITEVRPDKTIAFELYFDTFFHLLYRSFRFVWENDIVNSLYNETPLNNNNNEITIYPNPVNDFLQIEFNLINNVNSLLKIHDINGNLIYQSSFHKLLSKKSRLTVDVRSFVEGIYFIELENKDHPIVKKFVITR